MLIRRASPACYAAMKNISTLHLGSVDFAGKIHHVRPLDAISAVIGAIRTPPIGRADLDPGLSVLSLRRTLFDGREKLVHGENKSETGHGRT